MPCTQSIQPSTVKLVQHEILCTYSKTVFYIVTQNFYKLQQWQSMEFDVTIVDTTVAAYCNIQTI
jgi:hypothetical protein